MSPPPETPPAAGELPAGVLEACRRGDAAAFERLFLDCRDRVYAFALHMCGDPSEAADVTQDVFLKLMTRISQFRRESRFSTWLYRVVLNTYLDRRRSGRPWLSLEERAEGLTQAAPQEHDAMRAQAARLVRRSVGALSPKLRAPLLLRFVAGLTYEEIAEVLGVSAGTVASRLSRGLARLGRDLAHLKESV